MRGHGWFLQAWSYLSLIIWYVCMYPIAEEELGDELLDEEHLDESYEGDDNKPAADDGTTKV